MTLPPTLPPREPAAALRDPIFVVGSPRSGTTLLQCMLSAHSQVYSLPETHFFSLVLPRVGVDPAEPLTLERVEQIRRLLAAESHLSLPSPTDLSAPTTGVELFVSLVEAYRPRGAPATSRVVEKTPQHVLKIREIAHLFPVARFVHIVRNPLDVVGSWRAMPFAVSRSVLGYAREWCACVQSAEAFALDAPERIVTVVYERLVNSPHAELLRLCEFLNLSFEPAMVESFGDEAARTTTPQESWKAGVQQGVLLSGEGAWRQRLTLAQGWLVAQATRGLRERYGYVSVPEVAAGAIAGELVRESRTRYCESVGAVGRGQAARHALATAKVLVS